MSKLIEQHANLGIHYRTGYHLEKPKGGDLRLSEIHNYLVETYGGGVYAIIVNANSGETTDKISSVLAFDVCDIPELCGEG